MIQFDLITQKRDTQDIAHEAKNSKFKSILCAHAELKVKS